MEELAVSRDPDATIPGSCHRPDIVSEQALAFGQRGHFHVAEPIQAGGGCNPDVPFPVFKEGAHPITRQAVGARKPLRSSVHAPDEPVELCSDPQISPAIGEERPGVRLRVRRSQIARPAAFGEPPEPFPPGGRQQEAAGIVGEVEDPGFIDQRCQAADLETDRVVRLPAASTGLAADPEIPLPVLMQCADVAEPVFVRELEAAKL
ncbi:MAG TPA: hypothetical protein VG477_12040, partial [Thermoanaerobaculia bacterium]|nr:hypothetical protein [Thermoanaerobaculia bacterium]